MPASDSPEREIYDVETCPVEAAISVIGGKWKVLILWHLLEGHPLRFAELRDLLPGVSHKVLATQLRELEADGMLHREVFPEVPPRVQYSLTDRGRSVAPVLDVLCEWGESFTPAAPV